MRQTKRELKILTIGVFALAAMEANAATCPCDMSQIPDAAWRIDAPSNTFEKISIDTGVMCTDKIEVGDYSSGGFSIFKRLVGKTTDGKSQALAEITLQMISDGTRCIVKTENTGVFKSSDDIQQREESLTKDEFAACVADVRAYAARLNIACEKKK